ncbi:hypothetical protein C7T94_03120 [Pedobacter yulinensis]|uniref:TonB C-terminal domain-containing protein n=1 Tax=Pedobacter yulinensis TaxID=2126353 RepID=A0A2T3HRT3_9SPHI|nr:carboxypeptidase-like regulatory domain-containing protein [Pedobacter yulinensis]PST85113.1 hypothetical protein C7T94_03120 [Pedobacter yulinensis]
MNKDWLDMDMLEDYLDGKLNAHDMHFVERAVLEDPFVAEALEGLSKSPRRANNLSLLQKQLQERTARNEQKKKVWSLTWQRLSIAATAAVLFVSAGIIFWMKADNRQRELAGRAKKVDVVIGAAQEPALASRNRKQARDSSAAIANERTEKRAMVAVVPPGRTPSAAAKAVPAPAQAAPPAPAPEPDKAAQQAPAIAAAAEAYTSRRAEVPRPFIAGKVVSEEGKPLPGARISIPGSEKYVTTDRNGNFSLPAMKDEKITAASLGYTVASMIATPQKPVRITLKEEKNLLNEQVVVGYGQAQQRNLGNTGFIPDSAVLARRAGTMQGRGSEGRVRAKVAATEAQPAEGWEAYNAYLQKNSRLANQKAVNKLITVGFSIDPSGKPKDFNVLLGDRDSDKKYIDELIRLISSGPQWKYNDAGSAGKVTMVF